MTQYDRYNDGSNRPPRLQVQHSLWSLIKLPMNAENEWISSVFPESHWLYQPALNRCAVGAFEIQFLWFNKIPR